MYRTGAPELRSQCPERTPVLGWVWYGEPVDAQRGAVHSGPSRIMLSRRRHDRDNATEWLCRLFRRVVRAAGHGRSFFTTGRSVCRSG
ncbi:hypothetical protein SGPA1_20306 [Streptomyces misionensis JCM 4497]